MQRLALLALVLCAACGGGTSTGAASLSGVTPAVKAAAAETFVAPDAAGTKVIGWNILLYEDAAGGDCLEGSVVAKVGIYTKVAEGSQPEPLLNNGDTIVITTESPPTVAGTAAANMGVEGVSNVTGQVVISDFRLTADAKHAEYIEGSINAGGYGEGDVGVALTGMFKAPVCKDE